MRSSSCGRKAPGLVAGGKPETFVNERYPNVSVPQLFVYLPRRRRPAALRW